MDIKPLFEEDGYKPVSRKYVPPTHNRLHPKDSTLRHRVGKSIVRRNGPPSYIDRERNVQVAYGRKGESLKVPRATVCGLRDKMARAGSSAKVCKFSVANGHVDRRIDKPAPVAIGEHTATTWRTKSVAKSGLRARLGTR